MANLEAQRRASRIRNATLRARKDWVAYTAKQQRELIGIYQREADILNTRLLRAADSGILPPARLVSLRDEVTATMGRIRKSYAAKLRDTSMTRSVDFGIGSSMKGMTAADIPRVKPWVGTSFIDSAGDIHKYDPAVELWKDSRWFAMNSRAIDHVIRFRPTGLTFSQSVWQSSLHVENAIRNAINTGIIQGQGVDTVALQITRFVNPASKVNKLFAARRLARTEMKRAYKEGQIRYAMERKWIEEGVWRLGNIDACPDCVALSDQTYPKAEIPIDPHPQCLCWIQWHNKFDPLPDGVTRAKVSPREVRVS